jgi:phosphatidylglycerophosphate synthase
MSLHRATTADWSRIAPDTYNVWQRVAVKTHGFITIGNVITTLGLALVVAGFVLVLQDKLLLAVILVTIGRIADLLDGYAADKTGTKSPIGEAWDAGVDKLELAIAVPVLLFTPYASPILVICLLLHLAINVALFFAARRAGKRIHPTRAGKLSTATAWIAAGLFVLHKVDMTQWLQNLVYAVAVACVVVFITLAVVSAGQYRKQLAA